VDFDCTPLKQVHSCYHLTEDIKGHRLTDVLEVHFLELPKLFEEGISIRVDDAIVQWMLFIDGSSREVMEMLAEKNKDIWSAYSLLKIISNDEEARMVYEAREAELMDQRTRIRSAEEMGVKKGEEIGIKKGEEIGIKKIIQALLARGMTVEDVVSIAGMDISVVTEIQNGTLGHAENVKI
jgi:predicted transposase/invertase (TIGR01784 family)